MTTTQVRLATAIERLEHFYGPAGLTDRVAALEHEMRGADHKAIERSIKRADVDPGMLLWALEVKRMSGQINVAVHALGVLLSLPAILEEDEVIEDVCLGAGNTGHDFDLVTTHRIAEFKFVAWRGGAEVIRQNALFADLYHLAEAATEKRRELYVTNLVYPIRFLESRRAIRSVLTGHITVAQDIFMRYGDRYKVVRDYWEDVKDRVQLKDLTELMSVFAGVPPEEWSRQAV